MIAKYCMTVFRATKIMKDMYKVPLFQLRISIKKVVMKEQEQQYKYAGYSVSNVVCIPQTDLFHIEPREAMPKGLLHSSKDLGERQPA